VYGTRANAADFSRIYDMYLPFLAPPGTRVDRRPDRVEHGLFGMQTTRFATIYAPKGKVMYFEMSANEKPGGPYQASLLIATQSGRK
jgi:hypothetical protein